MLSRNLAPTSRLLGLLALAAFAVAGAAQPVLDKTKTDQSGDPLPPGAIARMGTMRWRHGDPVSYVAYTSDGKAVLTVSRDKTIRLWDRATGKEIRRFETKSAYFPHMCLAISGHFCLSDTVTCRLQVGVQAALSRL
jgi:WD40 repeat protein